MRGLLVVVQSGRGGVAAAQVTASLRGPIDPNTGRRVWTRLAAASSDGSGVAQLAVPAGVYRLGVRAAGFGAAQAVATVSPVDALTEVAVRLGPALSLLGRTVEAGGRQGVPLAELEVTPLTLDAEAVGAPPGDGPTDALTATTSDPQGRFRVDGLCAGWFRVEAHAPGHSPALVRALQLPHPEALVLTLVASSVLQGYVRARGAPVVGAEVLALGRGPPVRAVTGEGGGFALEVAGGTYRLVARKGAASAALEAPVTVAAGATATVELTLGEGARVAGTVRDGAGAVGGAIVSVRPSGASGDLGRAIASADGSFRVEGLPPGAYDVVADAPGHARAVSRWNVVGPGEGATVELVLGILSAVEGSVRDERGDAISGATVVATASEGLSTEPVAARSDAAGRYRVDGLAPGYAILSVASGDQGPQRFGTFVPGQGVGHLDVVLARVGRVLGTVSVVPEGSAVGVTAMRGGFDDGTHVARVAADGTFEFELPIGRWTMRAVDLATGEVLAHADVEVEPVGTAEVLLAPRPRGDRLTCTVLEADGSPSPNALLSVRDDGQLVTADGRGEAVVWAAHRGTDGLVGIRASNGARQADELRVPSGGPCVLRLTGAGTVEVQVSGAEAGDRLTLRLSSLAARSWSATQVRSAFGFTVPEVPAGLAQVTVSTGSRMGSGEVRVVPGAVAQVEIALARGVAVTGTVVDAESRAALPGAQIAADSTWRAAVQSDGAGRFRLLVEKETTHAVRVAAAGWIPQERTLLVGTADLELGEMSLVARVAPGLAGVTLARSGPDVAVTRVSPGGPGAVGGLQAGDIVLSVDGMPVRDVDDALARLKGRPGIPLTLVIRRGEVELTIVVVRAS